MTVWLLSVTCPHCSAGIDRRCSEPSGRERKPHVVRRRLALERHAAYSASRTDERTDEGGTP